MTRTKLLEIARGHKSHKGYKVEVVRIYLRKREGTVPAFQVRLDPGVGFPSGHKVLYTTQNNAAACEARDRFWMWLNAEGMTRA